MKMDYEVLVKILIISILLGISIFFILRFLLKKFRDHAWVKLNRSKRVLFIGLIFFVMIGLFPPYEVENGKIKYALIFNPPTYRYYHPYISADVNLPSWLEELKEIYYDKYEIRTGAIDFSRLFLQWGILIVLVGGIFLLFKKE